jgi:hypothetical protein
MKRLVVVALLAVLCTAGCNVDQAFVKAVDGYTSVILPGYENYVKNDPVLSDTSKQIRLDSVKGLDDLVEQAKKNK